jgi:hypothetical protein
MDQPALGCASCTGIPHTFYKIKNTPEVQNNIISSLQQ